MIFESKKLAYDGERYSEPLYKFDTNTLTYTYYDEEQKISLNNIFYAEPLRYHVNYCLEHCPERIQELVNNGTIENYLISINERVENIIDEQVNEWKNNDREYLAAKAAGDAYTMQAIANMLTLRARDIAYYSVVYA